MNNRFDLFRKHGYHIVGRHSAVKSCLWAGRSIKKQGGCYKSKFYGINSHQCIQMTPYLGCNQACLHCWRPIEQPVEVPEIWDTPGEIVSGSIKAQSRLMSGYGGLDEADPIKWKQSQKPKHVAISLAGEPTLYPQLKALIEGFHAQGLTTFVVSNGTKPEVIEKIEPSQLYLSLDAPDKKTYCKTCNPQHLDQWEQIIQSLEIMKSKSSRTAIRITLVKDRNLKDPAGYARLIELAEPDFVEVKAYMHLGYSRRRLDRTAMPQHGEILEFTGALARTLGYNLADHVELSRVALLSKDSKVIPVTRST